MLSPFQKYMHSWHYFKSPKFTEQELVRSKSDHNAGSWYLGQENMQLKAPGSNLQKAPDTAGTPGRARWLQKDPLKACTHSDKASFVPSLYKTGWRSRWLGLISSKLSILTSHATKSILALWSFVVSSVVRDSLMSTRGNCHALSSHGNMPGWLLIKTHNSSTSDLYISCLSINNIFSPWCGDAGAQDDTKNMSVKAKREEESPSLASD